MSRTLFIHIPRTAGTSIQLSGIAASTRNIGLKDDILGHMKMDPLPPESLGPIFANTMQKHIPYSYLNRNYINRFDRTFTIVRNPWARLVSLYHRSDSIPSKFTWYYYGKISWEEFLERMDGFIMTPKYYWAHPYNQWGAQLDWIDPKKVDVLRYENIHEDLNNYFNKTVDLPTVNQGAKVDYRSYYTEQKQKVADWFRVDIDYWGFDFESSATKNYWTL